MSRPEFEDQKVWERLYRAEEIQLAEGAVEKAWTEGEDGEQEFDKRVVASAGGKDVIDIGSGTGEFTLEIAVKARRVAGIDFSKRALAKSRKNLEVRKLPNVEFRFARADRLPYPRESFDLAISRRGPATDTRESLSEVHRVLKKDGQLITQEIGEKNMHNWTQIFGRGQMYSITTRVVLELERKLTVAGFRNISLDEFEANEYFASIQDVIMRMENSPIVPDFNRERDKHYLQKIEQLCTTPKGIITNSHRVLVRATK